MNETGIRLTIGFVLSIIWFVVLNAATDWPTVLVALAAILCGFCLSVIDVIFVAIVEALGW